MLGRHKLLTHPATRWAVAATTILLTLAAWWLARQAVADRLDSRARQQADDIVFALDKRMAEYRAVLRSGQSLFGVSPTVSRAEWRRFVAGLELPQHTPGIRGLGFSLMLTAEELPRHVAAVRREGFPGYSVRPAGARAAYSSIVYLEPFDWRNQRAFGYDMYAEPVRRHAMEKARDSGDIALSGSVVLVQETDKDVQPGVLMYAPVYRPDRPVGTLEERRAALLGFVYSPFRLGDLMRGIFGERKAPAAFDIYDDDGAPGAQPLWREGVPAAKVIRLDRQIDVGGRTWRIHIHADATADDGAGMPLIIAIGGLVGNVLLFAVFDTQYRARRRAERLAAELAAANSDLEDFAYIASHDLKEPLRGIHNYAGFLREDYADRLDGDGLHYLTRIERLARRMSLLIDRLLAWSRLGREQLHRESANLDDLLDEVLADIAPLIAESAALIERGGPLPTLDCEPQLIGEVFQNLLTNAIRYNDSTEKRLRIDCESTPAGWLFAVRDNGIGIAPRHQEAIFRIFKRLHADDKYGPGSGAGLTIVKRIVERHGGGIWVESQPGRGSTFFFTLNPAKP